MHAVSIWLIKCKNKITVLRPYREIVAKPFSVIHSNNNLNKLVDFIKPLPSQIKIIMAYTKKIL